MKKIISSILILALLASLCTALIGCNKNPTMTLAVVSDLHIVDDDMFTEDNYSYYSSRDKVIHLTEAIFRSFADTVISDDVIDTLFITGDMVESADETSLVEVASILKLIEDSGKQVYVINGNHDMPAYLQYLDESVSQARFREIFADFGYDEAVSKHDKSLSYAANVGKKYRLIAIDNINYYLDADTMHYFDQGVLDWVAAQLEQCKKDKRIPIAMTHCPLTSHLGQSTALFGLKNTPNEIALAEMLADNGVTHIYTGHYHNQDIANYTSAAGNTLTDVETGSFAVTPLPFRVIDYYKKEVQVYGYQLANVDEKYLPALMPDIEKAYLAFDGLKHYTERHFNNYVENLLQGLIGGINGSEELKSFINFAFENAVIPLLNTPLYIANNDEALSMEEFMQGYDVSLVQTRYFYFYNLPGAVLGMINGGDENVCCTSEFSLIYDGILMLFYYLDSASEQLAELFPDAPEIDIDIDTLVRTGNLELYDSNVIPFVFYMLGDSIPIYLQPIENNLNILKNAALTDAINELIPTMGDKLPLRISDDGKSLNIMKLLFTDVLLGYFNDVIVDTAPADNEYVIPLE